MALLCVSSFLLLLSFSVPHLCLLFFPEFLLLVPSYFIFKVNFLLCFSVVLSSLCSFSPLFQYFSSLHCFYLFQLIQSFISPSLCPLHAGVPVLFDRAFGFTFLVIGLNKGLFSVFKASLVCWHLDTKKSQ